MKKLAGLYLRKDDIYGCAYSQTTTWAWIGTAPYLKLSSKASPAEKARMIRELLAGSRTGIPHPTEFGGLGAPLLALAGVKSWSAFEKATKSLHVEATETDIRFLPYVARRKPRGFFPIPEKSAILPVNASDEEIAEAMDTAFLRCIEEAK